MKIIAHRGFWLRPEEQNSFVAFKRSLDDGFGIEFDARGFDKTILISHNLPDMLSQRLKDTLKALSKHKNFRKVRYAVNIKSDGIEDEVARLLEGFGILKNSFVFDMSVPSLYIFYKKYHKKLQFATRHSDLEEVPVLYGRAKWIWLDELEKHWVNNEVILRHIRNKKMVCIASPELHRRPYLETWKHYLSLPKSVSEKVCICTDFPIAADKFFNREKNDKGHNL